MLVDGQQMTLHTMLHRYIGINVDLENPPCSACQYCELMTKHERLFQTLNSLRMLQLEAILPNFLHVAHYEPEPEHYCYGNHKDDTESSAVPNVC